MSVVDAMAAQALLLPGGRAAGLMVAVSSLNRGSPRRNSASTPRRVLAAPLTTVGTGGHFQRPTLINAAPGGVMGVEPDLSEEVYVEGAEYVTAGLDVEDDFPYGKADGAHTWHKGDDNMDFLDAVSAQIKEAGGPNDHPGQAAISWLFLPVIFSGMAFDVQPEYLFLAAVLFIFAFIGIEIGRKPDKPSNFEYDPEFPDRGYKPDGL